MEYALNLCPSNNKMIILLNKWKYVRHPKWWDRINNIGVYGNEKRSIFDEKMYQYFLHNHPTNIIQLNNAIVHIMIQEKMEKELLSFIKYSLKFLNTDEILVENIDHLFVPKLCLPLSENLISFYFNHSMYQEILKLKEDISINTTLKRLVEKGNIKGLVFMFEFFSDISSVRFSNGDNLLHLLCKQSFSEIQQENLFRIIVNYFPDLCNIPNNIGNLPIHEAYNNPILFELLKQYTNIERNIYGDTIIHQIIRYG